jgi:hypothetical protein
MYIYRRDVASIYLLIQITFQESLSYAVFINNPASLIMKYFITLTTLLAAAAATALPVEERATVCPSGETEYCCELSVDGFATLSCQTRKMNKDERI